MGCDIHTYVEFADFTTREGDLYWKNFTSNGGSRNYVMFGVLAGVRVPEAQLFAPKGMPEGRIGYDTSAGYWNLVAPDAHPEWADTDNWVSLDQARSWVERGYSVGENDENGRLRRVSGTDWHSHSWLTTEELGAALDHYNTVAGKFYTNEKAAPAEWQAMLAAMRSFEANDKKARIVFWFDN